MIALILAAGRGTRLGGDDKPKCLSVVGGRTLIERYLEALDELHVDTTLVVGHGARHIEDVVRRRHRSPSLVKNPRFTEGSILSLAAGFDATGTAEGMLLMDGDVAFDPAMLRHLVESPAPDALLVDVGSSFTDEQFMAGVRGDRVVALRRGPVPGHDAQGEWVGFTKLSAGTAARFRKVIEAQIQRGETAGGYEDALGGLVASVPITCVPTRGLPWVEIDFADDLEKARALFGA